MRSILKGAFRRTRHPHAIDPRQRAAVGHPEISRPTLDDLEFDGGGPNFLRPLHVVENSAVACLALAGRVGPLAPFELRAQVVVSEFLPGDDVAELLAGDMNDPVFDTKNLLRIIVQSAVLQKDVEILEVAPVKQDNSRTVGRYIAARCESDRRQGQACGQSHDVIF